MKYILDDKEYKKLHQSNVDLKKHNKVLNEIIKDLQSQLKLRDEVEITTRGDTKEEKSAEEMFEELGYDKTYSSVDAILYRHSKNEQLCIEFLLPPKCISIFRNQEVVTGIDEMARYADLYEFKAINKQIEELGWD